MNIDEANKTLRANVRDETGSMTYARAELRHKPFPCEDVFFFRLVIGQAPFANGGNWPFGRLSGKGNRTSQVFRLTFEIGFVQLGYSLIRRHDYDSQSGAGVFTSYEVDTSFSLIAERFHGLRLLRPKPDKNAGI